MIPWLVRMLALALPLAAVAADGSAPANPWAPLPTFELPTAPDEGIAKPDNEEPSWPEPRYLPVQGDVLGEPQTHTVAEGETLYDIARLYGLGIAELAAANPLDDVWLPRTGSALNLPTQRIVPDAPRRGVVINLAEFRLYLYHPTDGTVASLPVGIGAEGHETPTGQSRITQKRQDPIWTPPPSIRKERPDLPASIPAGPDNPLGKHALNLGWPQIVIHGTNKPWSIGTPGSYGCLRMYPEHVAWLFEQVSVNTPVWVVHQPIKFGLADGKLWVQAHPEARQVAQLLGGETMADEPTASLLEALARDVQLGKLEPGKESPIAWDVLDQALATRLGLVTPISAVP
jgi:L,D-transpeptidase ErfK/SrfK